VIVCPPADRIRGKKGGEAKRREKKREEKETSDVWRKEDARPKKKKG